MKELTMILLIIIAVIGLISIAIVKIYYKDKEKDDEKERLEEFINSTKADYDNEKRRRTRRASKNRPEYSEAQNYSNTIDSSFNARKARRDVDEVENLGGTTALLRQRAKAMEEAPRKQVRRVRRQPAKPAPKQAATEKVPRTPDRVKTQMNKEEEVKSFQEPIKPEHTATINSAKQKDSQPVARQVPMTEKQKEFIANESNKVLVEDTDGEVKVVKSVLPTDTIEEIKESAKIEEASKAEEEIADKAAEDDDIVKKAEEDTAKLIQKIEQAKVGVEETLAETNEVAETEKAIQEELSGKETEETPNIEATIEKIKQVSKEKEEKAEDEKPAFIDGSSKVSEQMTTDQEEEPAIDDVEEAITPIKDESEAEKAAAEDKTYEDDLHILLNKDEAVEKVDEAPENEFITINSDAERSSTGNELINSAIKSIRNFRKPNVPEKPVVEELKDDIVPDDYAQDLGGGIEYIGDTITITPIHEEERDLANNQPNEDVDKIYKEINKESYNKTDDEELSDSFEDVDDDTSKKDANVYTKEDYKKVEAKQQEKKRRAENTKKILGSKGISEEEFRKKSEAKAKSKRTRKTTSAETEPVAEGQKRLVMNKNNAVEEVYINGTLFELKVGQVVMFDIKGETYSSQILRLKPGYIGVRYRSKKIWVKSNTVKKILK